jgi:hypothetical protein
MVFFFDMLLKVFWGWIFWMKNRRESKLLCIQWFQLDISHSLYDIRHFKKDSRESIGTLNMGSR